MASLLQWGWAEPLEPCRYSLKFPQVKNHYVEVEATFPCQGQSQVEVFLPVWTPGSYMVREYSRNLEAVRAQGQQGQPLKVVKTRKNRWLIECAGQQHIQVLYRCYCRELSVRNSWVDQEFALLLGAQMFLAPVAQLERPFEVSLHLPEGWDRVESGLETLGRPTELRAENYDQLVDSPILAGRPACYDFEVSGVRHRLVNQGEADVWDGPRSARDLEKIVETVHRFWGTVPYAHYPPKSYTFFNLLTSTGGGLEHRNSTVMMKSRWAQRVRADYLSWLSLATHEFFHAWNVKTLRPQALGPFDYEQEVYTPSLWVAEGLTAYYDNLLVRRAGFSSYKEYLEELSKDITSLQSSPGRLVQSLQASSWDSWIKFYRPDENSPNSAVSYYVKGSLVGWVLDAKIRQATEGKASLDDVMRRAYSLYSGPIGYQENQFRAVAEAVAGIPLQEFFAQAVDGALELDLAPALSYFGLRFRPPAKKEKGDFEGGWLGVASSAQGGRNLITSVRRDGPGYAAGFNVDDELIAINDLRLQGPLEERLRHYRPGQTISVLVARRERLLKLEVRLQKLPLESWQLEVDPEAPAQAVAHRQAWLGNDLK